MSQQQTHFHPFFDPCRRGRTLSTAARITIAMGIGAAVTALNYVALPDKQVFFEQETWILGAITATSILTLFVATEVLRGNLKLIDRLAGDNHISGKVVGSWLRDQAFVLAGLAFAAANTTVAHLLGVPAGFYTTPWSLGSIYIGFFVCGFAAGIGLWGIFGVIVLYLTFIPSLPHALDPRSPDGLGGIKQLGDSLWFFAMLTACVGLLVSTYLFSVDWTGVERQSARVVFIAWLSLPYLMAISIVLIPGLAVRRQIRHFKHHKSEQLRREKARLYASYKKFQAVGDDEIITSKRELNKRLDEVRQELAHLRRMRDSHLDRPENS